MEISQRARRIIGGLGLVVLLGLLAWGGSVWAVYGRSAGRVFGPDELSSVPVQRAAVVLGCVKPLPNGRDNLYYLRRIAAAAELYRSGKVR